MKESILKTLEGLIADVEGRGGRPARFIMPKENYIQVLKATGSDDLLSDPDHIPVLDIFGVPVELGAIAGGKVAVLVDGDGNSIAA